MRFKSLVFCFSKLCDEEVGHADCLHCYTVRLVLGVLSCYPLRRMITFPSSNYIHFLDHIFGSRAVAIEVYPARKNLVDVADIYHLWVLPKDYQLPFGIHPTRDPQGTPVQRGYDFNMDDVMAWNNSPERQAVYTK